MNELSLRSQQSVKYQQNYKIVVKLEIFLFGNNPFAGPQVVVYDDGVDRNAQVFGLDFGETLGTRIISVLESIQFNQCNDRSKNCDNEVKTSLTHL